MSNFKNHRKTDRCLNCESTLHNSQNYCHNCGQKNHDLRISINHLFYEFIESLTHLDTKIVNTLKSIFLYPGQIILEYINGKRTKYVPPIRLYVFCSFLFFLGFHEFLSSLERKNKKKDWSSLRNNLMEIINDNHIYPASNDLSFEKLYHISPYILLNEMNIDLKDSIRWYVQKLSVSDKRRVLLILQKKIAQDSLVSVKNTFSPFNLTPFYSEEIGKNKTEYYLAPHTLKKNIKFNVRIDNRNWTIKSGSGDVGNIDYYYNILTYSNAKSDSVLLKRYPDAKIWYKKFFYKTLLKTEVNVVKSINENIGKSVYDSFHFLVNVLSASIIVSIIIVSFILNIFYSAKSKKVIKRIFKFLASENTINIKVEGNNKNQYYLGELYYENLIFAIYIHAIFLILSLFIGLLCLVHWIMGVCMLLFIPYITLALKRVYQESWKLTIAKSISMSTIHIFCIICIYFITMFVKMLVI